MYLIADGELKIKLKPSLFVWGRGTISVKLPR